MSACLSQCFLSFYLEKKTDISGGAEASNWAVFDGWLAAQPVFLGTTKAKGRLSRDEGFPTGEMVGSKGGLESEAIFLVGFWFVLGKLKIDLWRVFLFVWSLKVSWLFINRKRWSWMAENTWCLHGGFHVFFLNSTRGNDPIWPIIFGMDGEPPPTGLDLFFMSVMDKSEPLNHHTLDLPRRAPGFQWQITQDSTKSPPNHPGCQWQMKVYRDLLLKNV